jgi:hypothetical protein
MTEQVVRVDAADERSSEAVASLPGSESSARSHMSPAREPGDLGGASPLVVGGRQAREGGEPQAVGVHAPKPQASEESDAGIVPKKSAKTWVTPVESMEGRAAAEGKLAQRNVLRTQRRQSTPTHLERVGERARKKTGEKFTNLLSHVRVPLLTKKSERWVVSGEELVEHCCFEIVQCIHGAVLME